MEAAGTAASSASASVLNGAVDWWRDVNDSPLWQDRIFHLLAVLYGFVSAVALVSNPIRSLPLPRHHLVARSIRIARSGGIARSGLICGRAIFKRPGGIVLGIGIERGEIRNSEFAVNGFSGRCN